jgi:hypothetical protein
VGGREKETRVSCMSGKLYVKYAQTVQGNKKLSR